jgi:hypothetical protein
VINLHGSQPFYPSMIVDHALQTQCTAPLQALPISSLTTGPTDALPSSSVLTTDEGIPIFFQVPPGVLDSAMHIKALSRGPAEVLDRVLIEVPSPSPSVNRGATERQTDCGLGHRPNWDYC